MLMLWGAPHSGSERFDVPILAAVAVFTSVGWLMQASTSKELAARAVMHERNYQRCVTNLTDGYSDLEEQHDSLAFVLQEALGR